jgi:uncharacterized membrane protein YoaK (UPF0700 family)
MHSLSDRSRGRSRTLRKLWPIHDWRTQAAAPVRRLPRPAVDKALANILLPALLGVVAGSTDTIGFLAFGGLFTAHITGNFVVLAAHVVSHHEISAAVVLSVPVFVAAILLTRWLAVRLAARGMGLLQPLLLLECLLLAGFLAMRVVNGAPVHVNAPGVIFAGMLGVAAMAVQNAVGQISLGAVSTTAMTANVARFALDVGEVLVIRNHCDRSWWRNRLPQAGPIAGFVIGCGLGAASEAAFDRWALALPVALAASALAISFAAEPRTPGTL